MGHFMEGEMTKSHAKIIGIRSIRGRLVNAAVSTHHASPLAICLL